MRGGLPLGLATTLDLHEFPETRLDLVPGETLVFCTDGLVEERGVDITIGMEALAEAVQHGPERAEELADHLADSLWQRWGSNDDVALLILRRAPDPGTRRAPRIHQYVHQADPEGLAEARLGAAPGAHRLGPGGAGRRRRTRRGRAAGQRPAAHRGRRRPHP